MLWQIIMLPILLWLHNNGLHYWNYRNPSCRTCTWCGKHQDQHVMAWEGTPWMSPSRGWWEDMY